MCAVRLLQNEPVKFLFNFYRVGGAKTEMVPKPKYNHLNPCKPKAGKFYVSVLTPMNTFQYYTGNYQIASVSTILFLSKCDPK